LSAHRSKSKANRICQLLDIRYPIFLGGMAHVSRVPLVAAVSDAGGLGIIGSWGMSAETLAEQIALVREKTNQPFGVKSDVDGPEY